MFADDQAISAQTKSELQLATQLLYNMKILFRNSCKKIWKIWPSKENTQ
jgi:hypothetical protein